MKGSDKSYEVGYGKPPKHSRIKPGEVRNPGGKTSETAKAERKAGEIAAKLQVKLLEAMEQQAAAEMVAGMSGSDLLKLIKDAMDREFGTATQKVEASGKEGGPIVIQWRNADD